MRFPTRPLGAVMLFGIIALSFSVRAESATPARQIESRLLSQKLGQSLKSTLQSAMKAGGPPSALNACHVAAPEIAASLSSEGVQVGRTALRVRNPGNRPTPEQREVLLAFSKSMAEGTSPTKLEYFAEHPDGSALYMKAIPMQAAPCMACHGPHIDPALAERIKTLYPDDQATGFKADDLRGAFVISWPPSQTSP